LVKAFVRKFFFLLNILLGIYSLLVFQLSFSLNVKHWLAGFLMMTMPVVLLLNVLFMSIWLYHKSSRFLLSSGILILGYPFIQRTYQINLFSTTQSTKTTQQKLSVMSYNMMWCDSYAYFHEQDTSNAINIIQSSIEIDADIKCVQELYNWNSNPQFRTLKKLRGKKGYYTYVYSSPGNENGQGEIGLAIFSKYPIISKQEKHWAINHNGLLAADIVINATDTVRIINIQLRSMGVRVQKVLDNKEDKEKVKKEAKNIFHQLKGGFEDRSLQVKELEKWIQESPYPVIVCGDFNELPYGFAYGKVRKYLNNAFEDAGSGFGFTYHKKPGFLRIDNQFYDSKWFKITQFLTYDKIPYSDHYPIKAEYILNK